MRQRKSLFFTLFLLTFLLMPNASGQECIVCGETCEIGADSKSAATSGTVGYAVVSPVGRGTVEPIRQAPRLSTLNGKTIAVVDVSFMSRVTHPEIKRLIERHYPEAKVLLLDEVGTTGPYPAPGITRRAKDEFQQRLRELGVDAVISGNGGCGLCTPNPWHASSHSAILRPPTWRNISSRHHDARSGNVPSPTTMRTLAGRRTEASTT